MPDLWTAMQFDNAVMLFGTWVENKLQERFGDEPRYSLAELLDPDNPKVKIQQNRRMLEKLRSDSEEQGLGRHSPLFRQ